MISPDIFKNVTSPGEVAALFHFQASEFEEVLVTVVEWIRKLIALPDDELKPLDRTTLRAVQQTIFEIIEYRFTQNALKSHEEPTKNDVSEEKVE